MMKNKMKVYYIEVVSDEKVNMMCVDMSDRHKIWVSHPNAKEISQKAYEDLKYSYNQNKKEVSIADEIEVPTQNALGN